MFRWDRITIKTKGKMAMRKNYWSCVLTSLILTLFVGGISFQINIGQEQLRNFRITAWMLGLLAGLACLEFLLRIFVFSPMEVGGCRFFVGNARASEGMERYPSVSSLLIAFNRGQYGKTVLTLFLRDLYIFFWTLLFIIPGIVKAYEYRMIPYLLAERPELSRKEVFAESRRMMQGQKFDTFFLDLSFFGWMLVSACTLGIADLFFVGPYMNATMAELYLALSYHPDQDRYDQYQGYGNQGYGNQGYDNQGYNNQGYNNQGYDNQGYNNQGYDNQRYDSQSYNNQDYRNQQNDNQWNNGDRYHD